ncbi:MAG: IF-2-associated domain-containing protein, partial [Nisaea sp.]|nr:IF-2-associated domain-containing protein [Nisaea sp.]
MTKTDEKDRKKLSLSSGGTLSLGKKIETSQVKQSFSHGRSKTVQVERRRKRVATIQKPEIEILDDGAVLKHLTSEERAARTRALKEGLQQQENQEAEASLIEPETILEDDKIKEHIKKETSEDVTAELTEKQTPIENQEHIEAQKETFEDEQKILEAARLAEEEEARQAKATSNRQLGRASEKTTATLNEDDIDGAIDDEGDSPKTGKKRSDSGKKIVTP